jgi:L-ascorbate oxidase
VLLKADQPAGNYWISSRPQYRVGSAAGYGVLRYAGADAGALPRSPAPQPDTLAPWSLAQLAQVGPVSQTAACLEVDPPGPP